MMDIEENEEGLRNVPLLIRCDAGEKTYARGTFSFDAEGYGYEVVGGPHLHFTYEDTVSIGSYQFELVIFLKEEEEETTEECSFELFKLIQQSDGAMGQQHFQMKGPYEVRLDLQAYGKETLRQVFTRLNEFSVARLDETEQNFPDLDNMITADDIDEDGNIVNKEKLEDQEEQQEEDQVEKEQPK